MPHNLELKYGLTAQELLDAIDKRFRLKVALEGAVAEVHFERKLRIASREGWLAGYESHDVDGMHDFTVTTLSGATMRVEVKTIRNGPKPQVELQKTRAAKDDPSSRYYGRDILMWSRFAWGGIAATGASSAMPWCAKFPRTAAIRINFR